MQLAECVAGRAVQERIRQAFPALNQLSHVGRRRIRTCTRDPKLRLFYVGIGLLFATSGYFTP